MERKMIVSQTFIARKAGVSQKTVSLYFKDQALVGKEVRKRLDEVVRKYNYLPNFAAHAMKTGLPVKVQELIHW